VPAHPAPAAPRGHGFSSVLYQIIIMFQFHRSLMPLREVQFVAISSPLNLRIGIAGADAAAWQVGPSPC
jgi:hypothetical protein